MKNAVLYIYSFVYIYLRRPFLLLEYLVPSREGTTYSNTYGELRGAAPAGSRSDPAGAACRREGRGEEEGRHPARRGGGRRGGVVPSRLGTRYFSMNLRIYVLISLPIL